MNGFKHLVQCHCVLPQFRRRPEPVFHLFVVFSVLGNDDKVEPKYAECNNCGAVHHVTEVGQSEIGAAAVGQSEIKNTSGSVTGVGNFTLPGALWGFYPQIRNNGAGTATHHISFAHAGTTYITLIQITSTSGNGSAQQRYITASPPYDLGDGEIPLFVFAEIDPSGDIVSMYEATEAPWHYNGPTNIVSKEGMRERKAMTGFADTFASAKASGDALKMQAYIKAFTSADIEKQEVTQEIKNADMNLIPHPFMSLTPVNTVVLVDPMSPILLQIAEMKNHDEFDPLELFSDDYLRIGSTELVRATPPGVISTSLKWKNTGR